jgi:hypothetical protein
VRPQRAVGVDWIDKNCALNGAGERSIRRHVRRTSHFRCHISECTGWINKNGGCNSYCWGTIRIIDRRNLPVAQIEVKGLHHGVDVGGNYHQTVEVRRVLATASHQHADGNQDQNSRNPGKPCPHSSLYLL